MQFRRCFLLISSFVILSVSLSNALTRWGVPTYCYNASYGVDDYLKISDLKRSIANIDRFSDKLAAEISAKYPGVRTSNYIRRTNNNATTSNFKNDNTNYCEIVNFSGHGNANRVNLYDTSVSSGEKKFGGYTRWVFFHSCLTLNVGPSTLRNWFDGVHAICGYRSLAYEFYRSDCGLFDCDRYRSEDVWDEFFARFIKDGNTIWDAWRYAVKHKQYENGNLDGLEVAIAWVKGNADNGVYFQGKDECFANTYNNPFNSYHATNIAYTYNYWVLGSPNY